MCACTPELRTPFCGRGSCVWPCSGEATPSGLDMLLEPDQPLNEDGSRTWFAVSRPEAVRGQPMALFRKASDAQLVGGRMTMGKVEIVPVKITLPPDVERPGQPMPTITVIS